MQETQTDIIIVGAGLSGLLALKKIVETDNSKKVEVYEALDRVGGRVFTYEKNGIKLDKGASWVGPTQTRMYELLNEHNLKTCTQYDEGNNVLYFKGVDNYSEYILAILIVVNIISLITQSWTNVFTILIASISSFFAYFKFLCNKRVRIVKKHFKGSIPPITISSIIKFGIAQFKLDYWAKRINLNSPYSSPNAQKFDKMTLKEWAFKEFGGEDNIAYKTFLCATDTIFGVDLLDMSLLHALFYIKSAGNLDNLINVKNGAQQDRIVGGSSQLPLAIYQNFKKYITLSSPVSKIDNTNIEKIVVTFENGKTRTCRRVILAIPPEVISKTINFTNMPEQKIKMLKSMKMGYLVKAFCVFKTPFWRQKGMSGNVLSPDVQPNLIYDLSNDKYGILLGFFLHTRQQGYRQLSYEMRQEYILNHFGTFFGESDVREQFVQFADENFSEEKYILGCPTGSFNVDGWKNYGEYWKKPINSIFWASTETSDIWNGYMEGAVRSGERAAQEVLKSL